MTNQWSCPLFSRALWGPLPWPQYEKQCAPSLLYSCFYHSGHMFSAFKNDSSVFKASSPLGIWGFSSSLGISTAVACCFGFYLLDWWALTSQLSIQMSAFQRKKAVAFSVLCQSRWHREGMLVLLRGLLLRAPSLSLAAKGGQLSVLGCEEAEDVFYFQIEKTPWASASLQENFTTWVPWLGYAGLSNVDLTNFTASPN